MTRFSIFNILFLIALPLCPAKALANHNYVRTYTYLNENKTDSIITVAYYDQWGRPDVTMSGGFSTEGLYLESKTEYDNMGRPVKSWVPTPSQGSSYEYDESLAQHAGTYFGDSYAYIRTGYDALGRVISTTLPGSAFQGHPTTTAYLLNRSVENIHKYSAEGNSAGVSGNTYYAAGELSVQTTSDPDGKTVSVYTDKLGRKVLERRGSNSDTYYVYNQKGQLRYVLQPAYQDEANLNKFSFQYEYDGLGRCQKKKLPGCAPIYYVYDKAGNCIFSQDGEQRAAGRWLYSIPDKFGRPCLTGTCTNAITYADTQYQNIYINAQYTGATNAFMGYSISGGITLSSSKLLSVNFYDDYSFIGKNSIPTSLNYVSESIGQRDQDAHYGLLTGTAVSCTRADNGVRFFYSAIYYDERRQPMQVRSTNLIGGINVEATTYTFTGQPALQSVRIAKGTTQASTVMKAEYENIYNSSHNNLLHQRVLRLRNANNGLIHMSIIQDNTYNDQGQIVQMTRGNHRADMNYEYNLLQGSLHSVSSNCGFQQTLFREDRPTQPLYNGSISSMQWTVPGDNILRSYSYQYDSQNRLIQAQYSEPINAGSGGGGAVRPMSESSLLGLIPESTSSVSNSNQYSVSYTYDKNSNIKTLQRRGKTNTLSYGLVDDLTISHSGNQLLAVQDNANNLTYNDASDFVDGADATAEYLYNENGALKQDLNRGISSILYDALGNMQKITFTGNRSIEYYYTADGNKLRTIHRWPRSAYSSAFYSDTTDYVCGFILKNRHLSSFQFDGGYYSFDNDAYSDTHFYVQDYMGNVRAVINDGTGTVEQVTHYYPYGGVIGDISTNHSTQKFKFEGKELDRKFGLDWYDIHARQYDAIGVPSWNKVDALAEKYYHLSPYVFAGGNPVNFGDYDGMDWYRSDSTNNYIWFNDEGIDNPIHEGYIYVGPKGSLCGELETQIDELFKQIWPDDKNGLGLYEDQTTIYLDNSSDSHASDMFLWLSQFQYGNGPEIRILTNPDHPYNKDLSKEKRVKDGQIKAIKDKITKKDQTEQWSLSNHLTQGVSRPIMNFVGTFDFMAYPSGRTIACDRKSIWSYFYHIPGTQNLNHNRSALGFFGNTYQFYVLSK